MSTFLNGTLASSQDGTLPVAELQKFAEIMALIKLEYVEEVDDEMLIINAIRGMITSLDPHSSYLNGVEYQDMKKSTSGEFGGIGIEINILPEYISVIRPIEGSPAVKAGIKKGDRIISVNGDTVFGKTKDKARLMLSGPINEIVELEIRRDQKKPFLLKIKRQIIKTESVSHQLVSPNLGLLTITTFNEGTVKSVKNAITMMREKSQSKALKGLVIDVRNNPGGLLDAAIGVVDLFIRKGIIVSTDTRDKLTKDEIIAHDYDILSGVPIVVLVNGSSASASEIVAGALQDHKRAVIIGEKTFGKGSVQNIIVLEDRKTALKLTTSRYFTPQGRSIQARGIRPDIKVVQREINNNITKHGTIIRETELQGHILNKTKNNVLINENTKLNEVIQKSASKDLQLYTALTVLKGLTVLKPL